MESKNPSRFTLGKQSSMAPERHREEGSELHNDGEAEEGVDPGVRLMYSANEGDLEGIREVLESGVSVNFRDIDDRTALHVAACQGLTDVVALLLEKGAEVDPKDRWGSTVSSYNVSVFCPFFTMLFSQSLIWFSSLSDTWIQFSSVVFNQLSAWT